MLCFSGSDCGQLKENLIWIFFFFLKGEREIRMKEKQWTPSTKGELVEGLDKELVCVCASVHGWALGNSFCMKEQWGSRILCLYIYM